MYRKGSCLCGAIRFEVMADLQLVEYCHCKTCRRAVGAPVMAWAGVSPHSFEIVEGKLGRYASSPGVERTFCGRCGSSLTLFAEAFPELIFISISALDDADSIAPEIHIWRSERLPWFETSDDSPRYLGFKYEGLLE